MTNTEFLIVFFGGMLAGWWTFAPLAIGIRWALTDRMVRLLVRAVRQLELDRNRGSGGTDAS